MNADDYSRLSPLTASPVSSTCRPSLTVSLRARIIGRKIGLASPICALNVGLDIALADPMLMGRPPARLDRPSKDEMMGDDAPEFMPFGMVIGIGMGTREELGVRGKKEDCDSRRRETEGETARRLLALGYGSYRSSTVRRVNIVDHDGRDTETYISACCYELRWW